MKKVQHALIRAKLNLHSFLTEERGDTNFISIMIVLGIILAVAIAFILLKDQIMAVVDTKTAEFMANFN